MTGSKSALVASRDFNFGLRDDIENLPFQHYSLVINICPVVKIEEHESYS